MSNEVPERSVKRLRPKRKSVATEDAFRDWMQEIEMKCIAVFGFGWDELAMLLLRERFDEGDSPDDLFRGRVVPRLRATYGEVVDAVVEVNEATNVRSTTT